MNNNKDCFLMKSAKLKKAKNSQDHIFSEISIILSSLASPVRLKIIHYLSLAPHSVEQLATKIDQSVANTSLHLKKMQREGVLENQTLGTKRIYSLSSEKLKDFWESIQNISEHLNSNNKLDIDDIYNSEITFKGSLHDAIHLITSKKATLLDIRPEDEIGILSSVYHKYVTHIPYRELLNNTSKLSKTNPIFIFCRGRICAMSGEITFKLKQDGLKVSRLPFSWHQIETCLQGDHL